MHTIEIYKDGSFVLRIQSPIAYTATYQAAEFLCVNRIMILDNVGMGSITLAADPQSQGEYTFNYEVIG
tara:strand:- start:260 stop:466 length:207 start_codon:yes stop_codon:yes gene_type:complete